MKGRAPVGRPARQAGGAHRRSVDAFLEMLVAERGAAPNTIDSYRRDLDDFAAFLGGRRRAPEDATADDVRRYLAALAAAGLSSRTGARRLSALRQFFRFLYGNGERPDDPTATVDSPRLGRPLPKYLSEDEVDRLLAVARERDDAEGMRRTALIEILYATGLRVSELVGLPLAAMSRDGRILIVRGKGGRYDQVPFGREAANALHNYLHFGRDRLMCGYKVKHSRISSRRLKEERGHEFLFVTRGGHGMTSQDLNWLVKRYSEKAGKRISPHTLRHACATHLLRRGADIRHIQKLLRHANLNTTQIYTHVAIEDLKEAQRRYHPRETEP